MKKFSVLIITVILNLGLVFVPLSSHADATSLARGVNMTFDVMPGVVSKVLPANKRVQVTLGISLDVAKFGTYCQDNNIRSLNWTVYQDIPASHGLDDNLAEKVISFQRTGAIVQISSTATVTANTTWSGNNLPDPLNFYGFIECPDGTNVAQSANVSVYWANLIYTCIVPNGTGYAYSCSPGNLSNCSDNPQCGGKCAPNQIPVSLCGSPAPAPSPVGPTPSSGPASQSYAYVITNPLAGGPNDLFDIIDIVTQWIMYISIPLAVLFIMYAGFLMLTAGPVPANFQKGRDILKYVILGLAIIFIGKGFVSLIISIIELGGTGATPTTQTQGGTGSIGWTCSNNNDCNSGLKCQNTMCVRTNGNDVGEPCLGGNQCAQGLNCDSTGSAQKQIAGRTVGSCFKVLCQPTSAGATTKKCISGPKINQSCVSGADCE